MVAGTGGVDRQIAVSRVADGLFVPASRVVVAAFQLSKLAQRVEPPGNEGPHREGAAQLHSLIEVAGGGLVAAGQQSAAQVTGGDHHIDGRVGPPGNFDGLGRIALGCFQAAACAFNLGHDRQRRAGPGGITDRPQHAQRLLRGRLCPGELPEP